MKYVKLFEEHGMDHSKFISQLCELMPGKPEESGIVCFNTPKPALAFTSKDSIWQAYRQKTDTKEQITFIRDTYDDILFGETEEEVQEVIKDATCYLIDVKTASKDLLAKATLFAARHGFEIEKIVSFSYERSYDSYKGRSEYWASLVMKEELVKRHRGRIQGKKFGV